MSKNYNINSEQYVFDYLKWVQNRFSINKSFGPSSNFIKNLELFIDLRLKQIFPKFKIMNNENTAIHKLKFVLPNKNIFEVWLIQKIIAPN